MIILKIGDRSTDGWFYKSNVDRFRVIRRKRTDIVMTTDGAPCETADRIFLGSYSTDEEGTPPSMVNHIFTFSKDQEEYSIIAEIGSTYIMNEHGKTIDCI